MREAFQPGETIPLALESQDKQTLKDAQAEKVSLTYRNHSLTKPKDWTLHIFKKSWGEVTIQGNTADMDCRMVQVPFRVTCLRAEAAMDAFRSRIWYPHFLAKKDSTGEAEVADKSNCEKKVHLSELERVHISDDPLAEVYYFRACYVFSWHKGYSGPESVTDEFYLVADRIPWEDADNIAQVWDNMYHPEKFDYSIHVNIDGGKARLPDVRQDTKTSLQKKYQPRFNVRITKLEAFTIHGTAWNMWLDNKDSTFKSEGTEKEISVNWWRHRDFDSLIQEGIVSGWMARYNVTDSGYIEIAGIHTNSLVNYEPGNDEKYSFVDIPGGHYIEFYGLGVVTDKDVDRCQLEAIRLGYKTKNLIVVRTDYPPNYREYGEDIGHAEDAIAVVTSSVFIKWDNGLVDG
jgi:hypothetical protein